MNESTMQDNVAKEVASRLLGIKAIKLNNNQPFTWSSGWKSPIYCDNRLSLSYPEVRSYIKDLLVEKVKQAYPNAESIAAVATAGIPQGVLIANELNLPFIYVRSQSKAHGMENLIEGQITPGQKTVVVEDLVSTGGSSLNAVKALRKSEIEVLGMVCIFTYELQAAEINFKTENVKLDSLSSYSALLEEAINKKYITEDQLESLQAWRVDPAKWKI